jgi:hypothetical protein
MEKGFVLALRVMPLLQFSAAAVHVVSAQHSAMLQRVESSITCIVPCMHVGRHACRWSPCRM